jgi:hypothetical protein
MSLVNQPRCHLLLLWPDHDLIVSTQSSRVYSSCLSSLVSFRLYSIQTAVRQWLAVVSQTMCTFPTDVWPRLPVTLSARFATAQLRIATTVHFPLQLYPPPLRQSPHPQPVTG